MTSPKVYIIVLNYRRWQDCRECLESVLRSTYSNYSVFVVDNNSGDNSLDNLVAWLEKWIATEPVLRREATSFLSTCRQNLDKTDFSRLPKLVFIENDENAGFAAGNNVVLKMLREKDAYFWLLNPDMVIEPDTLAELVQFSTQVLGEAIIGSVVRSYSARHKVVAFGGSKVNFFSGTVTRIQEPGSIQQLDYISGGCLFTHTSNLERLGLLPEKYFLYWEETDWCYTAKQRGHKLQVCATATCYDKGSTSIGKNFTADYYYARNGLMFISKFRRKNIPLVLFFLGMRFLKRVIAGRWDRARGIFKGTMDYFKMQPDEAK